MGVHEGKQIAEALAPEALSREVPAGRFDVVIADLMCELYAFERMDLDSPQKMAELMVRNVHKFTANRIILVADKRRLKRLLAPKAAEAEKRAKAHRQYYASQGLPIPEPYPPGTRFFDYGAVGPAGEHLPFSPARVIATVRDEASTMSWWRYVEMYVGSKEWRGAVECRFEDAPTDDSEVPFGTYGEADLEIIHLLRFDVEPQARVAVVTLDSDFMVHFFLHLKDAPLDVHWVQDMGHRKTVTSDDGKTTERITAPWTLRMSTFVDALRHVPSDVFAKFMLLMGTDFVEKGWWINGVTSINASVLCLTPDFAPTLQGLGEMPAIVDRLIAHLRVEHTRKFKAPEFGWPEEAAFHRALVYWTEAIPNSRDAGEWRRRVERLRANSHEAALEIVRERRGRA